jgi:hypothetical protein
MTAGAPPTPIPERTARKDSTPEAMEPGDETLQSGIVRVRRMFQSVRKNVNKTFAKTPILSRPKIAGHRTETPHDVQELINRITKGQEVLMQIPEQRAEYTQGMESAVASKGAFDKLLRELGDTRGTFQIAELTTTIADTLLKVQDVQSRAEQGVIEFLFTVGRQERKYAAAVSEHVAQMDAARTALDKVLTKQKVASETGGPGISAEKAEHRKRKSEARRLVFEEQANLVRSVIPEVELQTDAAYCQALLELLTEQRNSLAEAAELIAELDARIADTHKLADVARAGLRSKEDAASRLQDLSIVATCGPHIVEMLSAPDFAIALAIAEICTSPSAQVEEGEDLLRRLLRLLDDSDLCVPLLKLAISTEMPHGTSRELRRQAAMLFRVPSLAGALCATALQMAGGEYLKASFAPLVAQVCSSDVDFEIDARVLHAEAEVDAEEDDVDKLRRDNTDNLCKVICT